jgi:hypothetical protein
LAPVRALTAIAAVSIVVALLGGCGGGDETTTSSTGSTTSAPATGATGADDAKPPGPTGDDDSVGGAGDDGGGGKPPVGADPKDALEAFFTSGDPDVACAEVVSESLVSENYGDEKGCRQAQVPGAVPDSIEVKELDVEGDSAQAVVVPEGGPNDGFNHDVTLVNVDGAWILESLEADIPAGP